MDFYKQTMDSLHFYVFHTFDVGLRIHPMTCPVEAKCDGEEKVEDDKKGDEYFDDAFYRVKSALSEKRKNIVSFPRFRRHKNSKFNLNTEYDDDYIRDDCTDKDLLEGVETFINSLFNHLASNKVNEEIIRNLQEIIQTEEYQTDTLAIDISDFGQKGNVLQHITDDKSVEKIMKFFNST